MKKRLRFEDGLRLALAAVVLVFLPLLQIGCGFGPGHARADELMDEYLMACEDARVALPGEISMNLVAIRRDNENLKLVWEGVPGESRVLVVTWSGNAGFDGLVGKDRELKSTENLWVTAVPELKRFLRRHRSEANNLRIEQLLGLPPNNGKTRFVELWVSPKDLFRPSPDPEVTDHEAELEFPDMTSPFIRMNDTAKIIEHDWNLDRDVEYTYVAWFNHLRSTSYVGGHPYPWTRLGYTYDWGKKTGDHVGLSEFIIKGGSTVGVHAVRLNDDYYRRALAETADDGGGSWSAEGGNLSGDAFRGALPGNIEN